MNTKHILGGIATAGLLAFGSAAGAATCSASGDCDLGLLIDGANDGTYTGANAINIQPDGGFVEWDSAAGASGRVRLDVFAVPSASAASVQITINTAGSTEVERIRFGARNDLFTDLVQYFGGGAISVTLFGNDLNDDGARNTRFAIDWDGSDATGEQNFDVRITPVPVPAAGLLLIAGLGALGVAGRRKKAA